MSSILPFPLFHGTSTLFLNSIQTHGLGACNPVNEMHGVECLQQLQFIANRYLHSDDWWMIESVCVNFMCEQSISHRDFNFRHGSVYLTPSKQSAERYALTNAYGSELLSTCIALYRRLLPQSPPELLQSVVSAFPALFALLQSTPRPVLVCANGIESDVLRSESGQASESNVEFICECIESDMLEPLQQSNFLLLTPLDPEYLTYSLISAEGEGACLPKYLLNAVPQTAT